MSILGFMLASAFLAAPVDAPASPSAAPVDARGVARGIAGGTWTGKFLQEDWLFEFTDGDGRLQGRYKTSGGRNWLPLKDIVVSKRSVSFNLGSDPNVRFDLEAGSADRNLSGTVTLDGFGTIPFVATRAS